MAAQQLEGLVHMVPCILDLMDKQKHREFEKKMYDAGFEHKYDLHMKVILSYFFRFDLSLCSHYRVLSLFV